MSTQAPSPAPGAAVPFVSPIPFRDAVRVWVKVAANSFGGPAGQIAVAAFLALFRFKIGMIPTLAGSAALGLVYYLLVLA